MIYNYTKKLFINAKAKQHCRIQNQKKSITQLLLKKLPYLIYNHHSVFYLLKKKNVIEKKSKFRLV